jgi:hypothetical protein
LKESKIRFISKKIIWLLSNEQLETMEQKIDIFKIWPPDFAQKNKYRILNLSKTINELISPKKIFFVKIRKTCFVSKIAHDFFYLIYFLIQITKIQV